jgi:hypothetical protein
MTRKITSKFAVAALIAACACIVASAGARSAEVAPGQQPPQSQAPTKEQPQQPPNCVASKEQFKPNKTFVIDFVNSCERRVRCTIHAYVVTSRGPKRGHKTLTLGPKSKGKAAHKSYVMRIGEAGGEANTSHKCRVL